MKNMFKGRKGFGHNAHIVIALGVVAVLFYLNSIYKWLSLPTDNLFYIKSALIAVILGQAPDVDQPGSKIRTFITVLLVGIIIYSFFNPIYKNYGIIAAVIIGALEFIHHREILHSVLGGLILSAPLLYLGWIYFAIGLIAFLSHIIAEGEFSLGWEKDWHLLKGGNGK